MQAAIDSAIPPPAAALGRGRIPQVDYLKGILITLMVLFHLSWFSTHYLDVTRYVYVFHMSGFIILSGFFANTGKTPGQFLKTWLGILAPYLVFESLYYLALSHLPASVPGPATGWTRRSPPSGRRCCWPPPERTGTSTCWPYACPFTMPSPAFRACPLRPGWPYAPPSWPPSPGSIRRSK